MFSSKKSEPRKKVGETKTTCSWWKLYYYLFSKTIITDVKPWFNVCLVLCLKLQPFVSLIKRNHWIFSNFLLIDETENGRQKSEITWSKSRIPLPNRKSSDAYVSRQSWVYGLTRGSSDWSVTIAKEKTIPKK